MSFVTREVQVFPMGDKSPKSRDKSKKQSDKKKAAQKSAHDKKQASSRPVPGKA